MPETREEGVPMQVRDAATGPYFLHGRPIPPVEYDGKVIPFTSPEYAAYAELGLFRRLLAKVRDKIGDCAANLRMLERTAKDIADATRNRALLATARPYLDQVKDQNTQSDGLRALEEIWVPQVEAEIAGTVS